VRFLHFISLSFLKTKREFVYPAGFKQQMHHFAHLHAQMPSPSRRLLANGSTFHWNLLRSYVRPTQKKKSGSAPNIRTGIDSA
jgi:hypothetical protein